jgi:hypothetical protein
MAAGIEGPKGGRVTLCKMVQIDEVSRHYSRQPTMELRVEETQRRDFAGWPDVRSHEDGLVS